MPGISERKLVQEHASLAGFRLDDKSVKTLVNWLANGANEEELQRLFNAVETGDASKGLESSRNTVL